MSLGVRRRRERERERRGEASGEWEKWGRRGKESERGERVSREWFNGESDIPRLHLPAVDPRNLPVMDGCVKRLEAQMCVPMTLSLACLEGFQSPVSVPEWCLRFDTIWGENQQQISIAHHCPAVFISSLPLWNSCNTESYANKANTSVSPSGLLYDLINVMLRFQISSTC